MMKIFKLFIYSIIQTILELLYLPLIYICAFCVKIKNKKYPIKPKLVWGSVPIINNSYWSKAMIQKGYCSSTFTTTYYSSINDRSDWDIILQEKYRLIPNSVKPLVAFLHSLFLYDVFFISVDGYFLGSFPLLKHLQGQILKIANKRVVVIPYGADAFVYKRIGLPTTLHGLLMSYPLASRRQKIIGQNLDYWCKHADAIIPGFMGGNGFGRWDVLIPSQLSIDLELWKKSSKSNNSNGIDSVVTVVHAPNHRGIKGTEFIINAVEILRKEGFKIELILLEKIKNIEVRRILEQEADILIEQIVYFFGMNGIEGMASGLPTISCIPETAITTVMRRWSFFGECPLISANPENIVDVLRKLLTKPELRQELGNAGRAYVEKYHGLDSAQYLFDNVIDYVYGRKESLINLYHPLLGEYPNRSPKIQHSLVNNQILD